MKGKRLKILRKALGLTQEEFAERIGRSWRTVQNWEAGVTQPKDAVLRMIAKLFQVSYEWLKTGEGQMWDVQDKFKESVEKAVWAPVLSRIPAGYPVTPPSPSDVEEYIALPPGWLPEGHFLVKVMGNSMESVLFDGDYVVVRPASIHGTLPEHYVGRVVVAANADGEYTIKRLVKRNNEYWLVPENPEFKEEIKVDSEWIIVGVVVDAITRRRIF